MYGNWHKDDIDFDVDIKQDIETYIDWDVDTKFTVDIEKDIKVDIDVDVDVKDQGSVITAVVKDLNLDGEQGGAIVIGDTTAVEDVLSSASLQVQTANIQAQLTSDAMDKQASPFYSEYGKFDSATFTEINLGIDNVAGEFTIVTLEMQALVDG